MTTNEIRLGILKAKNWIYTGQSEGIEVYYPDVNPAEVTLEVTSCDNWKIRSHRVDGMDLSSGITLGVLPNAHDITVT